MTTSCLLESLDGRFNCPSIVARPGPVRTFQKSQTVAFFWTGEESYARLNSVRNVTIEIESFPLNARFFLWKVIVYSSSVFRTIRHHRFVVIYGCERRSYSQRPSGLFNALLLERSGRTRNDLACVPPVFGGDNDSELDVAWYVPGGHRFSSGWIRFKGRH